MSTEETITDVKAARPMKGETWQATVFTLTCLLVAWALLRYAYHGANTRHDDIVFNASLVIATLWASAMLLCWPRWLGHSTTATLLGCVLFVAIFAGEWLVPWTSEMAATTDRLMLENIGYSSLSSILWGVTNKDPAKALLGTSVRFLGDRVDVEKVGAAAIRVTVEVPRTLDSWSANVQQRDFHDMDRIADAFVLDCSTSLNSISRYIAVRYPPSVYNEVLTSLRVGGKPVVASASREGRPLWPYEQQDSFCGQTLSVVLPTGDPVMLDGEVQLPALDSELKAGRLEIHRSK